MMKFILFHFFALPGTPSLRSGGDWCARAAQWHIRGSVVRVFEARGCGDVQLLRQCQRIVPQLFNCISARERGQNMDWQNACCRPVEYWVPAELYKRPNRPSKRKRAQRIKRNNAVRAAAYWHGFSSVAAYLGYPPPPSYPPPPPPGIKLLCCHVEKV